MGAWHKETLDSALQAYLYDGYWEDIGTIEAFYESNLALTDSPSPKFRWGWSSGA